MTQRMETKSHPWSRSPESQRDIYRRAYAYALRICGEPNRADRIARRVVELFAQQSSLDMAPRWRNS